MDFKPHYKAEESSTTNPLPSLIERVTNIQTRVSQADIYTLNTRLKRQHIVGGDVGHLSKATLKAVIGEIDALRVQFKSAVDAAPHVPDDAAEPDSLVTRKDLRALLKLVRDLLAELTQLRSLLNDVILDPEKAALLRDRPTPSWGNNAELAKTDAGAGPKSAKGLTVPGAMGWFANPIQKLFNPLASPDGSSSDGNRGQRGRPEQQKTIRALRPAPKLAPAISATTTTVNVEFGHGGTGRATVSDVAGDSPGGDSGISFSGRDSRLGSASISSGSLGRSTGSRLGMSSAASNLSITDLPQSPTTRNQNLFGIFAGAPSTSLKADPWIVVPKKEGRRGVSPGLSALRRGAQPDPSGPGFQGQRQLAMRPGMRATSGYNPNRLSRIVDAVIDDDAASIGASEEHRTLRSARNLSDSSIHSTFVRTNPVNRLLTPSSVALSVPVMDAVSSEGGSASASGSYIDRESVLQALSRKVQGMRSYLPASPGDRPQNTAPSSTASATLIGQTSPTTPSAAASPPKPIPGRSRQAARSSSRSERSPSSAYPRGSSWMNVDSLKREGRDGGFAGSFKAESSVNSARKITREYRGGMDF